MGGTRKETHSLWRSWKGAGPLSGALSSLSLFMSMGYMEPGSSFTGGGRERKAIEKQGGRGEVREQRTDTPPQKTPIPMPEEQPSPCSPSAPNAALSHPEEKKTIQSSWGDGAAPPRTAGRRGLGGHHPGSTCFGCLLLPGGGEIQAPPSWECPGEGDRGAAEPEPELPAAGGQWEGQAAPCPACPLPAPCPLGATGGGPWGRSGFSGTPPGAPLHEVGPPPAPKRQHFSRPYQSRRFCRPPQ